MLELSWEKNVCAWLDSFCMQQVVPSDRAKSRMSIEECFRRFGRKLEQFKKQASFPYELEDVFPSEYLTFTEEQKESTLEYIEKVGYFTNHYCWLLCHILAQYERAEDLDNPIAQAINDNYQWLKEYYFKENQQAKIHFYALKEEKPKRPNCVSCGSSNVVSSSLNWVCKDCGRAFRKKPRTHHYSKA